MKVVKNDLKKILSKLKVCVGKNVGSPLAFQNKEGKMKITATDNENVVVFQGSGDLTEDMELVLDYKSFLNICKLRGKELVFIKEDNKFTVKDDNTELVFAVDSIDTFNFSKNEIEGEYLELNTKDFQKLIDHGSFVREENGYKKFMSGVEITVKDKKITALSTDGKRLAKSVLDIDSDFEFKCVFSNKCIEAIKTFETEKTRMRLNDKMVNFNIEGYDFYLKMLDCEFPDTSKFFTLEETHQYEVNRNEMIESISMFDSVDGDVVNIECKENKIIVSSSDVKSGVTDTINSEKKCGEDFSFKINKKLFADIFKNLENEKIVIKYTNNNAPIGYFDNDKSNGVIMPIKTA